MKIAVMQPYLFPYIGYFQLISAVDKFVFYDDVNYIKGGWINRNRIIINNDARYFSIQLKEASSFKKINEIQVGTNAQKVLKTIRQAYVKAPYYGEVINVIMEVFSSCKEGEAISELAITSVMKTCHYLEIDVDFEKSSLHYNNSIEFDRLTRLVDICKKNRATKYINSAGGVSLYNKNDFSDHGIELQFMNTPIEVYNQFTNPPIIGLSIIDVLMFNSKEKVKRMLMNYNLK